MQPFSIRLHLYRMFAIIVRFRGQRVKGKISTRENQGKEAMKHRSTQLGVRKNPDSPRVHGLRLTVDSSPLKPGSQTGNSSQSKPSPSAREIRFALRFEHRAHIKTPDLSGTVLKQLDSFGYTLRPSKRMARSGQIPGCRLGRRWYFRPSDLALLRTGVSSSLKANRVAPQLSCNPKRRA